MNIQPLIDLAKANPEKFYVKDDDFILELSSGTLMPINVIDDMVTGQLEDPQAWRKDIVAAVDNGDIAPEVLERFDKKYCK